METLAPNSQDVPLRRLFSIHHVSLLRLQRMYPINCVYHFFSGALIAHPVCVAPAALFGEEFFRAVI